EVAKVVGLYQRALDAAPNDWMLRQNYAQFLVLAGGAAQAVDEHRLVLRQMPHHYRGYIELGNLRFNLGDLHGAKDCFEQAIKLDPDLFKPHLDLARVLAAQGQVEQAVDLLTARVYREPNRAEALGQLAGLLLAVGRPQDAEQRVQESFALNPEEA